MERGFRFVAMRFVLLTRYTAFDIGCDVRADGIPSIVSFYDFNGLVDTGMTG